MVGIARSIVESPMNIGSSGSELALFCATRIKIRLKAIPEVGKLWVDG